MDGAEHRVGAPEEDARIPEEFAAVDEYLGEVAVGFLGEGFDAEYFLVAGGRFAHLDVAVSGFGTCGLDAEGKEGVVGGHEVESVAEGMLKLSFSGNQVVAWCDDHNCVGVFCEDMIASPGDAGCGVAAGRFEQNVVGGNVGELFAHEGSVAAVGYDNDVFFRYEREEAVVGHLQQCAACAEKVDELFGAFGAAIGPEAAAYASAHDYAITV